MKHAKHVANEPCDCQDAFTTQHLLTCQEAHLYFANARDLVYHIAINSSDHMSPDTISHPHLVIVEVLAAEYHGRQRAQFV